LTHIIEHLEGARQGTHPHPRIYARNWIAAREKDGEEALGQICARGKSRGSPERSQPTGGDGAAARAWGRVGGVTGKEKELQRIQPPGVGYMRPPWGHQTLLKWHRTRPVTTGLMRREDFKMAHHRMLALASSALGHAGLSTRRTSPDAVGTLFLRPVSAVQQTHRTGRTETASGASSGAPLGPFST